MPIFILTLLLTSCNLGAGKYPYRQDYHLSCSEDKIIQEIKSFKERNPEYIVPKVSIHGEGSYTLKDAHEVDNGPYFVVYFYLEEQDEILLALAHANGNTHSTLSLARVNRGLDIGNWNRINKDLSFQDNKRIKKVFEDNILSEIKNSMKE